MFVTKFNKYRAKPRRPAPTIDDVLVDVPNTGAQFGTLDSGFDDMDLQRVAVGPALLADFAGDEPRLERR